MSVFSDDGIDRNGHATLMLQQMQWQNPNIRIMSVKALDDTGHGTVEDISAGIVYATDNGADIINLSFAGADMTDSSRMRDAVRYACAKNVTVIAAAGNGGYDTRDVIPANIDGIFVVGASDGTSVRGDSNRGACVDAYVEAESTSLAAAKVSGFASKHLSDGWGNQLFSSGLAVRELVHGIPATKHIVERDLPDARISVAASTYTVAYYARGGTGTMASTGHTYGTASALRTNSFTKTHHLFNYWESLGTNLIHDTNTYSGTAPAASSSASYTNTHEWSVSGPFTPGDTYQVDFDCYGNGRITSYFYGVSGYLQVAQTECSNGATSTATDGNIDITGPGSTWRHYSIRWKLGSAGNASVEKRVLLGRVWRGSGSVIQIKNVTFGKSADYSDRSNVTTLCSTNGGTVTMWAKWDHITEFTINPNGGAVTFTDSNIHYATLNVPYYSAVRADYFTYDNGRFYSGVAIASRMGYEPTGLWTAAAGGIQLFSSRLTSNGTGMCFQAVESSGYWHYASGVTNAVWQSMVDDITLYVQWKPTAVTVTFDGAGGTLNKATMTSKTGYPLGNSSENLFDRWNILPTGGYGLDVAKVKCAFVEDAIAPGNRVTRIWRDEPGTAKGGFNFSRPNASNAMWLTLGQQYTFTTSVKGHGWWRVLHEELVEKNANGNGIFFPMMNLEDDRYVPLSQTNIAWNSGYHCIIMYDDDIDYGNVDNWIQLSPIILQAGGLDPLPSATRVGYTFKGWFTEPSGGIQVDDDNHTTIITPAVATTYYAQWEANETVVHYLANGGTGSMPDSSVRTDECDRLSPSAFRRPGYLFMGWSMSPDDTIVLYRDNQLMTDAVTESEMTLYAQWRLIEGSSETFQYASHEQGMRVSQSGWYKIEAWGGDGGSISGRFGMGGTGGYSYAWTYLDAGEAIYVTTGGKGSDGVDIGVPHDGGFNGGGSGRGMYLSADDIEYCGAGGGATHVALGGGLLRSMEGSPSLTMLVAGGGGGAIYEHDAKYNDGGAGGGTVGGNGGGFVASPDVSYSGGTGGTQLAGGAPGTNGYMGTFGAGGEGNTSQYAKWSGGGAGWYGGGNGSAWACSSGGGSGHIGGGTTFACGPVVKGLFGVDGRRIYGNTVGFSEPGFVPNPSRDGQGYARILLVDSPGIACAVLTDSEDPRGAGRLIFFRSFEGYSQGAVQTATDLLGNTYHGRVYAGIENISQSLPPWESEKLAIRFVMTTDKQDIRPAYLNAWFADCTNLESVEISRLNTYQTVSMRSLFARCVKLDDINLTNLDTASVTAMDGMFAGCTDLAHLDLDNFDMSNIISMSAMFDGMNSLISVRLGTKFRFCGATGILPVTTNDMYTDRWYNSSVLGAEAVSPLALAQNYDGSTTSGNYAKGTYVREYREMSGTNDAHNQDADGDGYGDNIAFSVPSSLVFVVRSDGTLVAPTGASIKNHSDFPIHVSSVQASCVVPYTIVPDATMSLTPDAVSMEYGLGVVPSLRLYDFSEKTMLPDMTNWNLGIDEALSLCFSGKVNNLTQDISQSSASFATMNWYVTAGTAS